MEPEQSKPKKPGALAIVGAVLVFLLSLPILFAGACGGVLFVAGYRESGVLALVLVCLAGGIGLLYVVTRLLKPGNE